MKSGTKLFQEDFCFHSLCLLVKKKTSIFFALRIYEISNTNEKTLQLLHDSLDLGLGKAAFKR